MTPPLEHPLGLLALIAGMTAAAFWLERRYAWARQASASLLVIAGGALLSNLGLVPLASPAYDAITGPVTSLAIVWLLFAVDLSTLKAAGPRMLLAFAVALAATAAGALAASLALGHAFADDAWRLAGVMTGTYSGGSVNFVAVSRAVGLEDELLVAATAADNVMTALWVGATLALPLWLAGPFRLRRAGRPASGGLRAEPARPAVDAENPLQKEVALAPVSLLALLTIGLLVTIAAEALEGVWPAVPAVLWLTTLALALAQLPWVRRLRGTMQLGLIALNLFFAVIGIYSRVGEILKVGVEVFYFTAIVVLVHGLLAFGAGWLLRLDVETTAVASQAAVGGPSTALALAVSRGWTHLQLPAVAVGLLGYAVGNYAGLAVAAVVRRLLGG